MAARGVDRVLVAVDVVGLRGRPNRLVDGRQRLPIEPIDIPQQGQKIPPRPHQRFRDSGTAFVTVGNPDARVPPGDSIQRLPNPRLTLTLGPQAKLPVREVLPPHRREHSLEHRQRWVGDRRDDRDLGARARATGRLRKPAQDREGYRRDRMSQESARTAIDVVIVNWNTAEAAIEAADAYLAPRPSSARATVAITRRTRAAGSRRREAAQEKRGSRRTRRTSGTERQPISPFAMEPPGWSV